MTTTLHYYGIVIKFVRDTLGCQCPDSVFSDIDHSFFQCDSADSPLTRLSIGGRLLIYVAVVPRRDRLTPMIETLLDRGIAERDQQGFNRFRLVIAGTELDTIIDGQAGRIVAKPERDQRCHLHILPMAEVGDILDPAGH